MFGIGEVGDSMGRSGREEEGWQRDVACGIECGPWRLYEDERANETML